MLLNSGGGKLLQISRIDCHSLKLEMCTIRVYQYSALDDLQQFVKFVSLKLEVY